MATQAAIIKQAIETLTKYPDAATARHYALAILREASASVSKEKCALCGSGFKANEERVAGFVAKHGKAAPAHSRCAAEYIARRDEATRLFAELDKRVSYYGQIDMETCACGHGALAHAKDANENLLDCEASGCDCDHFHYEAPEIQDEAA